jgi:hypothetical protein
MRSLPLVSPRPRATLVAAVGLAIVACGSSAPVAHQTVRHSTPTPAPPTATPTPAPPPPPPPPPTYAAPLIVQIDNAAPARPQSGLNGAELVYEYEVEYGISRFSAFFRNPPPVQVGPVRSARLATIQLLRIYGGVLAFSGASQYVSGLLDSSGLPHFNETSAAGDLFRVGFRGAPYNLYTDGGRINDLLRRANAPAVTWSLFPRTDIHALPGGGTPAGTVTVPISNYEQPVFTWRGDLGGYVRSDFSGLLVDPASGVPVHPSTVIVLQVPVKDGPQIEDGCCTHGLDHTVIGSGPAQVFIAGGQYQGSYTQGASGPPQITFANGTPIPVAPGQVWIVLVRTGSVAQAR